MSNDNEAFESLRHRLSESETRHKAAEKLLQESEERFSTVVHGIEEYFYVLDRFFRFVFASRTALASWNKRADQVIGHVFLDAFPEAKNSAAYETHCRVMLTREPERFEVISPINKRWIEVHVAPTQQGGLSVGLRDIEDRKRAHEALRRSEAKYRTLFEAVNGGFCILEGIRDEHGQVVDFRTVEVNEAFDAHSGLKNALGKSLKELLPRFPAERFLSYCHVLETGEQSRSECWLEDTQRWCNTHLMRVGGSDSNLVAVIFEDITERKLAELPSAKNSLPSSEA